MGSDTAADDLKQTPDSGTAKRLLRHIVPTQEKKRPQDLIPNGIHPVGLDLQTR
jgi:hypothetical protein